VRGRKGCAKASTRKYDGQAAHEQHQQVAQFLPAIAGDVFDLLQKAHVGEIHFFEPPEIEQVDDNGDCDGGKCGQE
jgi:hypothetical protein